MGDMRRFSERAPRIDLNRPAVLVDSAGIQQAVTVVDVSSGGFKLKVSKLPRIGEHVRLRVEGSAEIQGEVRWAVEDEAGGVFLSPVDYSSVP